MVKLNYSNGHQTPGGGSMDTCTSLPSLRIFNTLQVSPPLAAFRRVLAQVWRVVSRMYLLLFGWSSSDHWIERQTGRAFLFSPTFFRERKCHLNTEQRLFQNSSQFHSAAQGHYILCKRGKKHDLYKGLHFISPLSFFKKNCSHVKIPPRLSTESRK